VPFPALVLAAGLVGLAGGALVPEAFAPRQAAPSADRDVLDLPARVRPTPGGTLATAAAWLAIWALPIVLLLTTLGREHALTRQAVFFSKVAVVTFGGAYAVLAYVAQQAVEVYGWIKPGEMLDGLGMAETTPGPLIQVVQFVGFLGAHRAPEPFAPYTAALLGSVVTTWVTYAPCFLWIFIGAPYVEALRRSRAVQHALSGIMAAVVGVILNLSVWFALHVLFGQVDERWIGPLRLWVPDWTSLDPGALAIAAVAALATFRWHWSMPRTLGLSVALGLAAWAVRPA
jgi:chromate transporter